MNKRELITRIKCLDEQYLKEEFVLDLIEQLDEPQRPVVPQFVADWYEENKDDFETKLFNEIDLLSRDLEDDKLSEFEEWVLDKHTAPFQTLVNMHQFGYTVEKEKRYLVKIKGAKEGYNYLNNRISSDSWFFSGESEPLDFRVKHTRKELKAGGFCEVFNSPLFEVEEVEE